MTFQTSTEELWRQQPRIEKHLAQSPYSLTAFSFVNIFLWKDFFRFEWAVIDDCLCVFAENDAGTFLYLPPLGHHVSRGVIEKVFQEMKVRNGRRNVTRIENVPEQMLELFPPSNFLRHTKCPEYCYFRQEVADLKGNAFKSKRSDYNHFLNHEGHRYVAYEEPWHEACRQLYASWAKAKGTVADQAYQQMIEENKTVHEVALRNFRKLNLTGRAVFVGQELKAYTFGFPLNREMFCVLFEVADVGSKGLPVFIFREFCRDQELRGYKFINAMDDFAMPNVARAKLSFRPTALLHSYVISPKP
jgi:uncharacterized protein